MPSLISSPVALFVFNRPETTRKVLSRIAEVRPPVLYVVADGPRPGHPTDADRCAEVRDIVSRIDWPVELVTNFSQENLGCGRRMSSGISWVFDQVEEAILLEDDCLPSRGFFTFCEELLERYRDDERVGIISGNNFVDPNLRPAASYYFSRYTHIWGWASWRRSWRLYDFEMSRLGEILAEGKMDTMFDRADVARFWQSKFETVARQEVDTWDYQLVFTSLLEEWHNIMPSRNLVTNIGFGADATHTVDESSAEAGLPAGEPDVPLIHPDAVTWWKAADSWTDDNVFCIPQLIKRPKGPLKRLWRRLRRRP